jgi:hypothetical protein
MRYKVFFTTGETCFIDEERYLQILLPKSISEKSLDDLLKFKFINLDYVTHVLPEDALNQEGVIVKPQTPEQIAEEKAKEHDQKISNPNAILESVKEKNKNEQTDNE